MLNHLFVVMFEHFVTIMRGVSDFFTYFPHLLYLRRIKKELLAEKNRLHSALVKLKIRHKAVADLDLIPEDLRKDGTQLSPHSFLLKIDTRSSLEFSIRASSEFHLNFPSHFCFD